MASIVTLAKKKIQNNPVVQTGQTATYSEDWMLDLDSEVSALQARTVIKALGKNNAYGWPRIGVDAHPDLSVMFPTQYEITRNEDLTTRFDISLNYTDDINQINKSQNARNAKPSYDYQDVDVIEEVEKDPINNKMITASNGEPPFPLPQRQSSLMRITVVRNESRFNADRISTYKKKVNSGSFRIDNVVYPAREILCESIIARSAIDADGVQYFQVTYRFLHDPDRHVFEWVDAARGIDKDKKRNPEREIRVYKLDGNGKYMNRARQEDPSDVVYNENFLYDEISMTALNL